MLNLVQLQAFLAIADAGSFQGAADALHCAQPTVSQQLRKLEDFLGVQLVTRQRARSTLTAAGATLLPQARALLRAAQRTRDQVRGRRLALGAASNVGVFLAPRLIAAFEAEAGGAGLVDLTIGTNRQVLDAVAAGEVDLALTEWAESQPGFAAVPWRRERLVVIAAPGHPIAARRRITKAELLGEPLLGGEPGTGTGTVLRALFGVDAHRVRSGRQLGSTAAVKEAVKAGLGISIVLAYAVTEDVAHGSLVTIEIEEADVYKTLQAVFPDEAPDGSLTRRFVGFLQAVA